MMQVISDKKALEMSREVMINYLKLKMNEKDWHGVADAAMDLREIEAKISILPDNIGEYPYQSPQGLHQQPYNPNLNTPPALYNPNPGNFIPTNYKPYDKDQDNPLINR